jgi:hypothetical protein
MSAVQRDRNSPEVHLDMHYLIASEFETFDVGETWPGLTALAA